MAGPWMGHGGGRAATGLSRGRVMSHDPMSCLRPEHGRAMAEPWPWPGQSPRIKQVKFVAQRRTQQHSNITRWRWGQRKIVDLVGLVQFFCIWWLTDFKFINSKCLDLSISKFEYTYKVHCSHRVRLHSRILVDIVKEQIYITFTLATSPGRSTFSKLDMAYDVCTNISALATRFGCDRHTVKDVKLESSVAYLASLETRQLYLW